MGGRDRQKRTLIFLSLFLFSLSGAGAADIRTIPITVNVILDGSREMGAFMDQAADWLCDYLVDGVLSGWDRLNVWVAGEKAQRVYADVPGEGGKEAVKKIFRSFVPAAADADFTGALGEAAREKAGEMVYTVLVCASPRGTALDGEGYLRYSRNTEFSGWRVVTVALDAGPGIREAVQAYPGG
jgi:hypothetical protein